MFPGVLLFGFSLFFRLRKSCNRNSDCLVFHDKCASGCDQPARAVFIAIQFGLSALTALLP